MHSCLRAVGKLLAYFHKQTHAKAKQLHIKLRCTLLENRTVQEYLLLIRNFIDNLASIGDPVPSNQHLDVILEGLPQKFSLLLFLLLKVNLRLLTFMRLNPSLLLMRHLTN